MSGLLTHNQIVSVPENAPNRLDVTRAGVVLDDIVKKVRFELGKSATQGLQSVELLQLLSQRKYSLYVATRKWEERLQLAIDVLIESGISQQEIKLFLTDQTFVEEILKIIDVSSEELYQILHECDHIQNLMRLEKQLQIFIKNSPEEKGKTRAISSPGCLTVSRALKSKAIDRIFKSIADTNMFGSCTDTYILKNFKNKIEQEQSVNAEIDGWTLLHFIAFTFANNLLRLDLDENNESNYMSLWDSAHLILPHFKSARANLYKQDKGTRTPFTFLDIEFGKGVTFYNAHFACEINNKRSEQSLQPTLHTLLLNVGLILPYYSQPTLHALCLTSYIGRLLIDKQRIQQSLEWRDKFGRSVIFYCIFGMQHVSAINAKELIKVKTSLVNELDKFSRSPLYYALLLRCNEELINILCEASSFQTVSQALIDYLWDTSEFSNVHLNSFFRLEEPLYDVPWWARGQVGAGPKVEGSAILKIMCDKYKIVCGSNDSDIISNLFQKLSMDAGLTPDHKKKLMDSKLKDVFAYYARHIDTGCHEMLNAAETQTFSLKVALGEHLSMERTAKPKEPGKAPFSINNLIEKQRIKTHEYLMSPVQIKNLPQKQQSYFEKDKNKYVFHGHIGAGFYLKKGEHKDLVTTRGAPRGDMHKAQLKAIQDSMHHLSLSRRLSKVTDEFQACGKDFLDAYENGGFHNDSYMKIDGKKLKKITSSLEAYELAVCAQFNLQKRQTTEKNIRREYLDTSSMSESYTEIDTDNEVSSSDDLSDFKKKVSDEIDCFKQFKEKHKL